MNHDPLEQLWQQAAGPADADTHEAAARAFVAGRRRVRRWRAVWLAWTFLALTTISAIGVAQFTRPTGAGDSAGWPIALMLILPWFVALRFFRAFRREAAVPAFLIQPWAAVVSIALADNRAARHRLAWVAALFAALLPVTIFAVRHLHASGKASFSEACSMAALFGAAFAVGAGFMLWRYYARLRPERRLLEARALELDAASRT